MSRLTFMDRLGDRWDRDQQEIRGDNPTEDPFVEREQKLRSARARYGRPLTRPELWAWGLMFGDQLSEEELVEGRRIREELELSGVTRG